MMDEELSKLIEEEMLEEKNRRETFLMNKAIYIEKRSMGLLDIFSVLKEVYEEGRREGTKSL